MNNGVAYLRIQDDKDDSIVVTDDFNVSNYSMIKVEYWFFMLAFDGNEDFFLEYSTNTGSSWVEVQQYARGTVYENNNYYNPMEEFPVPNGATNMRIRFRCNANKKDDIIFIDDVKVEGL